MRLKKFDRLVIAGDSITDVGRARPAGEGLGDALGHGYPALVDALLCSYYPELMIRVTNMGIGGNTSRDLLDRWDEDVLQRKPDFILTMIGVNDVWRQFDLPQMPETHVLLDEYESNLRKMLESGIAAVGKDSFVLMTPHYLEPNRKDPMRATMDKYGEVCRKLADEYGVSLADTQSEFDRLFESVHPNRIAWDRVHPNLPGHMLIARTFLRTIGFDFSR